MVSTPISGPNNDKGDRKSPLKTQRMLNLEKQLHETKELVFLVLYLLSKILIKVNQYKNKIESLKSLITATPNTSQLGRIDYSGKLENIETFEQHKQIIKQEVLSQVSGFNLKDSRDQDELSPKSSANIKIVKPIKGGQSTLYFIFSINPLKDKKSSIASQKFFDILKQQYRFNRSFINGIGEGILNKQKQTGTGSKNPNESRNKGV